MLGILRIRSDKSLDTSAPVEEELALAPEKRTPADETTAYLERLFKLIPGEILTVYPLGRQIAPGGAPRAVWVLVCLALLLVIRSIGTYKSGRGPQWGAVGIAAVSYTIWIYVLGDHIPRLQLPEEFAYVATLALLVWCTLIPYLYRGDTD